ncbi:MAG TPA: SCO family protein [Burkholderiaceae bacterium]|nr:SCO family protein [Burkholderiaceae bacterium]
MRRAIATLLALGAIVLATLVFTSDRPSAWRGASHESLLHGHDVSGEDWGADFVLSDPSGRERTLRDYRGKVVLLSFGYTHCPDVCPTTLAKFAEVRRLLGADAGRVQVLFVTVDPARDSAELLRAFVPSFDPSFVGLRGTPAQTDAAIKSFRARYQVVERNGDIEVDHTASTYLIDTRGKTRVVAPYDEAARQLADDVRELLRAG